MQMTDHGSFGESGGSWKGKFVDVLHGSVDQKNESRALIKSDIGSALRALNRHRSHGLARKGAADVLDEVAGMFADPNVAREQIESVMSPERLRELIAARGDLASSAATVVSLDTFVAAMLMDIEDLSGTTLSAGMMIYLWACKAADRGDFQEFLDYRLDKHTIEYVLLSYLVAVSISRMELLTNFDELGLDENRSLVFIDEHKLGGAKVDPDELEAARMRVDAHKKQREQAATIEEEVVDQDEEVASELDI